MRALSFLMLFLAAIPCRASDRVIAEMRDNDSLFQTQILPNSSFNVTAMEKIARRFLGGAAKDTHTIAVLSMYADQTVAAQEAAACEGSYLQWKLLYDHFPEGALLAAEVISLRGDAVLWLRTSEGIVLRRVLSGKDPTQLSVAGVSLEILVVTGRIRSRFEGCGIPQAVDPVLYLSTHATLNAALCQQLTAWLAARLGVTHIWAEYANDHWFPCDGRFPLRYPFSVAKPLPSEADYFNLPGFGCSILCDGEPRCIRSTPLPRADRLGAR